METVLAEILDYVRSGQMLVLLDEEDREWEGDLFLPACFATQESVNFMITYGKGLLCAPMPSPLADALRLPLLVPDAENEEYTGCRFTLPVDARACQGSGISALDRALTLATLATEGVQAEEFIRPGHIFPLRAHRDGLLGRRGHTEAAVFLCEAAGLPPVGSICEIIGDDGAMLRGDALVAFARHHHLPLVTISDICTLL